MKTKLLIVLCIFFVSLGNAQNKVGTIDSELVVGLMPETKKVLNLLSRYANRLDSTYQIKYKEYQDKVAAYQKNEKTFSEEYNKIKLEEITSIENELQQNQTNANRLIQLKRNELMRPLYRKLEGVISEIAKAGGYSQIISTKNTEFAYIDPNFDITKKVIDKLGIELPKEEKKE